MPSPAGQTIPQGSDALGDGIAIELRGVGKQYGQTTALRDVDLDIRVGEVHAVIGENGAGKSTCLSMLAGRVVPTAGQIRLFGEDLPLGDPRAIRHAGIASIYQELTIVPHLSTQANVFLGQDFSARGVIREGEMKQRYAELCEEVGVAIPVGVDAGSLSVSQQQLLEIMRGLVHRPRVILFDEPTAALAERERERLHGIIAGLRSRGVTIVFISHNLDEVLGIADTVTVFRSGRLITTRPADAWTKAELVQAMTGRELERKVRGVRTDAAGAAPVLRVEGLTTRRLRDISLAVAPGEVVGVAGLIGSGRSTLLKALAGNIPDSRGEMWIEGKPVRWPTTVRRAKRYGISILPEDRKIAGLFHGLSACENISIGALPSVSRFGVVSKRGMSEAATEASGGMGFDADRLEFLASSLSGGNQQKLLLARAAMCAPAILLADEPTRGVDVGAKAEIMRTLREMAADGLAVLTTSSELEDLELLCDRVVVLSHGELVGRIDDADQISVQTILQMAFRVKEEV